MCTYTISISLKPAYLNTFVKFISGRAGDVRFAKRIWKFQRRNLDALEDALYRKSAYKTAPIPESFISF